MKDVKRIASYRRKVYSPLHAGCQFTDQEICAAASRPQPLLLILKYCQSIECLFVGLPAISSNPSLAEFLEKPIANNARGREQSSHIKAAHSVYPAVWSEADYEAAYELLRELPSLKCLSCVGLPHRIPDDLARKLDHMFCPIIHFVEVAHGLGPRPRALTMFEHEPRRQNLQDRDFSDVIYVGDRCFFMERHAISGEKGASRGHSRWTISLNCPAGTNAFKIGETFEDIHELISPTLTTAAKIKTWVIIWNCFRAPLNKFGSGRKAVTRLSIADQEIRPIATNAIDP
jgi:hypothetical protein